MRLNLIGNAFLVFAILLSAAGIAEPSSGLCAAVTFFVFAGFAIVTQQSHNAWTAGYKAAQLDMSFSRQDEREKLDRAESALRCGGKDCLCAESADD